jgi:hypothetical protein
MNQDEVTAAFQAAIAGALVTLSFFEGYFEAKNEGGDDAHVDLRDRASRARDHLQVSFLDLVRGGGE